jgi:hypothetical protein
MPVPPNLPSASTSATGTAVTFNLASLTPADPGVSGSLVVEMQLLTPTTYQVILPKLTVPTATTVGGLVVLLDGCQYTEGEEWTGVDASVQASTTATTLTSIPALLPVVGPNDTISIGFMALTQ